MNKFIKTLYIAATALFALTSCLKGDGVDPDIKPEATGLSAGVTNTSIVADGRDSSQLIVTFNNESVSEQDIVIYDAETNQPTTEWNGMSFSTIIAGEYSFYVQYTDSEGVTHTSDIFTITVVADINLDDLDESGLSVRVTTNVIEAGKSEAIFIIRYNGTVLKDEELAKVKVYMVDDSNQNISTTLPTHPEYGLLYYSTNVATTIRLWFSYKTSSTINGVVKITAVDYPIPSRPIDTNPESTSFNYRAMFTQFTSLTCGICPMMLCAFETLAHDSEYSKQHTFVAIQSSDDISNSTSEKITKDFGITSYPQLYWNLDGLYPGSYGYASDLEYIKSVINSGKKQKPSAGIAARTSFDGKTLLVRALVKAAEENEYRIGAWIVENNVYGVQTNYYTSTSDGLGYNVNVHKGVLRAIKSNQSSRDYTGFNLGTIQAGSTTEYLFDFTIENSWVANNCQVLLFVAAKQSNGGYKIVNSTITPSIQQGIDFEYVE